MSIPFSENLGEHDGLVPTRANGDDLQCTAYFLRDEAEEVLGFGRRSAQLWALLVQSANQAVPRRWAGIPGVPLSLWGNAQGARPVVIGHRLDGLKGI